jgi:hypothetical protein
VETNQSKVNEPGLKKEDRHASCHKTIRCNRPFFFNGKTIEMPTSIIFSHLKDRRFPLSQFFLTKACEAKEKQRNARSRSAENSRISSFSAFCTALKS